METSQFWVLMITLLGGLASALTVICGVVFFLVNQVNRRIDDLQANMNRQFSEQKDAIAEQKADMNRQFSEQKDALAEQKADTNRQFGELRDDMNRRFKEQDSRMDRMEAQHGELVGEGHRMGKRLGRIDMMLELLTQRRPSVRQMFRRRADAAA